MMAGIISVWVRGQYLGSVPVPLSAVRRVMLTLMAEKEAPIVPCGRGREPLNAGMRVRTNDESGDVLGEMRKSTAHTVAGWLVCPGNHLNVRQRGGWIDGKAAEDNARPRTGAGRATTQSIRFGGAKAKRGVYSRLGAWQMSKQRATPNWTRDSCTVHVHFEVHVDAEGSVYPGSYRLFQ